MSVGLLIISHGEIGASLLHATTNILGICPLATYNLAVRENSNLDLLKHQARKLVEQLDQGDGVLVLTDLYGSTPHNIAAELIATEPVSVVSGVNLPMLLRVFNYPGLTLHDITEKAISGATLGIVNCHTGN